MWCIVNFDTRYLRADSFHMFMLSSYRTTSEGWPRLHRSPVFSFLQWFIALTQIWYWQLASLHHVYLYHVIYHHTKCVRIRTTLLSFSRTSHTPMSTSGVTYLYKYTVDYWFGIYLKCVSSCWPSLSTLYDLLCSGHHWIQLLKSRNESLHNPRIWDPSRPHTREEHKRRTYCDPSNFQWYVHFGQNSHGPS